MPNRYPVPAHPEAAKAMLLLLLRLDSMKCKNLPRRQYRFCPILVPLAYLDKPQAHMGTTSDGIPHSADAAYTWDDPKVQYPDVSHVYHGYLASFSISRNPKKHRCSGVQEWHRYRVGKGRCTRRPR
ncbi:hypothetical protein ACRE_041750 [Hapsidospora chrysogenum ATCC 11550]|uniref:Uncharacterized protein n=1 Tax=Hapsidospora chrysogenum (strain ATCC 11550 / CBS 779.69 / DSM 880 / IAM 14645 / JCM 23072 / IMI 49137) TaxID=857340 RepID=A0A086T6Q3_HAPC1|nr:hypothetical protein ACRE_041750 [Hapsidospora chrysogenum ATCC 11550]